MDHDETINNKEYHPRKNEQFYQSRIRDIFTFIIRAISENNICTLVGRMFITKNIILEEIDKEIIRIRYNDNESRDNKQFHEYKNKESCQSGF